MVYPYVGNDGLQSPFIGGKIYAGPSIGWVDRPAFPSRTLVSDGSIKQFDRLLLVDPVTPIDIDITVPTARSWLDTAGGGIPVTVQDRMGCFTNGVTITLHATGDDKFNGEDDTVQITVNLS